MRFRGVSWVLSRSFGDRLSSSCYQRGAGEDPRPLRQRMDGFDLAAFSGQAERLGRDLQELCGVAKVEPGFDPVIGGAAYREGGVGAERCDALAGPAIAVARLEAVAVEEAGNQIVADDQHQLTHGLDSISRSAVALSAPTLGQAQLAVGATHPVDDENDLGRRLVDIGHNLMDEGAYNALLEASIRRRRIPDRFEIRGENAERSWISNRCGHRRIMQGDLALALRRVSEPARCTPPAAERPRSSSITSISDQPSAISRSRMAYCSALLSRLCNT